VENGSLNGRGRSITPEATEGECIAIDGKTLRRSFDRRSNKKALHMISAWATNNNLVLGQVKTEEKSNEITAIPELLKVLELKGCIVTIDAMGCQEAIAEQIIEGQGDYTLAVKANQGKLYDSLIDFFQVARAHNFKNVPVEFQETVDKAHGRVEIRRYWISNCLDSVYKPARWKKLCAIGLVESERHENGKTTYDKRYYILSYYHIALFAQAVRSHWGIENKLHWTLDMTFREDESRIRRGNASHDFGVIRHLALNLLKMEKSKLSIKKKRLRAALNDQFRANVLCGV
jgi:predicted transposase YbfD/YdcC